MYKMLRNNIEVRQIGPRYYILETNSDSALYNEQLYWHIIYDNPKNWFTPSLIRFDKFGSGNGYSFNSRTGIALLHETDHDYAGMYILNTAYTDQPWRFLDVLLNANNNLYIIGDDVGYPYNVDEIWPNAMTDKEILSIKVKGA